MKLLVLTTSWPRGADDPSGAFVAEMTGALSTRGFEPEVVALDAPPGGALRALERGRWPGLARAVGVMALRARRARPDAVLSHWLLPSAVIGAMVSAPQVGVAHGGDLRLLRRLPRTRRWLARRLAGLVSVSTEGAQLLDVARTLVTPMGLPGSELRSAPRPAPTPLRVLFLGRLVPIKGLAVLLEAARGLPDVRFTVAGDGPERRLRRGAPPNVSWLGSVAPSERPALLARHHLLCVPSVGAEGAPRTVIEAYAAGRGVIASDVGGLRDLVPEAARVPVRDARALRQAIARLGPDAPRVDVSHLAWDRLGDRLATFLLRCYRSPRE